MPKQKSERRKLAEQIAKEKRLTNPDYKIKSAMRYLQRAIAPKGKERIIKPTFRGLSEPTKKKAKRVINRVKRERKKSEQKPIEQPIERQIEQPEIDFLGSRSSYREGQQMIVTVSGTFKISRGQESRAIRLYLKPSEVKAVVEADSFEKAIDAWLGSEDNTFIGYLIEARSIKLDGFW